MSKTKVYLVFGGEYEQRACDGVFSTKEYAENFANSRGSTVPDIEERTVDEHNTSSGHDYRDQCSTCRYIDMKSPGQRPWLEWCYMFKDEPTAQCAKRRARIGPPVTPAEPPG